MELHDHDAAMDMMKPFFERTTIAHIRHIEVDPDFDPIRQDKRFQHMLQSAKLRLGIAKA